MWLNSTSASVHLLRSGSPSLRRGRNRHTRSGQSAYESSLCRVRPRDSNDARATRKSDREVTFIPVLHAADSTVTLPSVTVAGRNRYIQNIRHRTALPGDMLVRPGSDVEYSAYAETLHAAVGALEDSGRRLDGH